MVLLRSNPGKSTFFPVFKVFIAKAILSLQPVIVSKNCNQAYTHVIKEKPKSCFLKLYFLVASKTSQNLNIFCTFHVSTMKACLSSNLKKIWTKKYIYMSYISLKVNLHIFQW